MVSPERVKRKGFALITLLWVLAAASIILLRATQQGRDTFNSARNRATLERANWRAEACLEVLRSLADHELASADAHAPLNAQWVVLGDKLQAKLDSAQRTPWWPGCVVRITANGSRLDVNHAPEAALVSLFHAALGTNRQDLADALLDWRDADDTPRSEGAERSWYIGMRRIPPSNGTIDDISQLRYIRGFEDSTFRAFVMELLGTDEGAVSVNNASAEVLQTIPGFTEEGARFVTDARGRGHLFADLNDVLGRLPRTAAESLLAHFPDAAATTTFQPMAWTFTIVARAGSPALPTTLEARVTRSGNRAAIVRRRNWP